MHLKLIIYLETIGLTWYSENLSWLSLLRNKLSVCQLQGKIIELHKFMEMIQLDPFASGQANRWKQSLSGKMDGSHFCLYLLPRGTKLILPQFGFSNKASVWIVVFYYVRIFSVKPLYYVRFQLILLKCIWKKHTAVEFVFVHAIYKRLVDQDYADTMNGTCNVKKIYYFWRQYFQFILSYVQCEESTDI